MPKITDVSGLPHRGKRGVVHGAKIDPTFKAGYFRSPINVPTVIAKRKVKQPRFVGDRGRSGSKRS